MRGRHRSRTPESVLSEIRALVAEGVREINFISQDTTYYGMDLWTEKAGPRQPVDSARGLTLASLLREVEKIDGEFWIRLLYTHPAHWSDELIATIAECRHVARYIDIPLQHIDESMLRRMRRETSRAHIETLIAKLRSGIPGVALRTTFIIGFPGETETEFETLLDFIERTRFERLGIFKYSREEGSRAAKMLTDSFQPVKVTMAEASEPKKETVRITLPPRGGDAAAPEEDDTVLINLPSRPPASEPPPVSARLVPKPANIPIPRPPVSQN